MWGDNYKWSNKNTCSVECVCVHVCMHACSCVCIFISMQTGPNKIVNISPRYGDGLLVSRGYIDGFCPSVGYHWLCLCKHHRGQLWMDAIHLIRIPACRNTCHLTIVPQSESIIPHKIKKGHPLHQLAGLCSQ